MLLIVKWGAITLADNSDPRTGAICEAFDWGDGITVDVSPCAGAAAVSVFDRGNVQNTVTAKISQTFGTLEDAFNFRMNLRANLGNTADLLVQQDGAAWLLAAAVLQALSPLQEGCSVVTTYKIVGGAWAAQQVALTDESGAPLTDQSGNPLTSQ